MSWGEIKKINSDMNVSLDNLIRSKGYIQVFKYTGSVQTLIVPTGIKTIFITACGGGGSGNTAGTYGKPVSGSSGGNTVIAPLVTLIGGGGASTTSAGASGGIGGGAGGSPSAKAACGLLGEGGGVGGGGGSLGGGGGPAGGVGGLSLFGFNAGLSGEVSQSSSSKPLLGGGGGYGAGGGGGSGSGVDGSTYPVGGGGAMAIYKKPYTVTPGSTISITVGAGASRTNYNAGGDGIVIVEW